MGNFVLAAVFCGDIYLNDQFAVGEANGAKNLGISDNIRIVGDLFFIDLADNLGDFINWRLWENANLNHRRHIVSRHVGNGGDGSVGDEIQRAVVADNLRGSQSDCGYRSSNRANLDVLANFDFLFKKNEKATDNVSHKSLGTKANCQAEDPS